MTEPRESVPAMELRRREQVVIEAARCYVHEGRGLLALIRAIHDLDAVTPF